MNRGDCRRALATDFFSFRRMQIEDKELKKGASEECTHPFGCFHAPAGRTKTEDGPLTY